jgi:hypothetical protein
METLTMHFEIERETKNTVRYAEVAESGQPPRIGTLYVQKWALGKSPPERLAVTIAAE